MRFLHYPIHATAGQTVKVTLRGNAANVMLLDAVNFGNYRAGRGFRYYGGHYATSPVLIPVPHGGHWNLVIDLGGAAGHVDASVAVI